MLNVAEMTVLFKLTCRFHANLIKIPKDILFGN